jgi:hypothetical protein
MQMCDSGQRPSLDRCFPPSAHMPMLRSDREVNAHCKVCLKHSVHGIRIHGRRPNVLDAAPSNKKSRRKGMLVEVIAALA